MTNSDFEKYFLYLKSRSRIGYIYRNYWLYPKLVHHLSGRTLDVGCGLGDMLAFRKDTVGIDINPLTVDYCVSLGLDARLMQPNLIPFKDEEFDSILLDNVLEHLSNPTPLLYEIQRVIKKEAGRVVIGVPGIRGWKSDPDHKIFYDKKSLISCLQKHGFVHESSFFTPLFRSRLLENTMKQYCVYGKFYVKSNSNTL